MKKGILHKLKEEVVLGAEGYVFELERRGYVKAGAFVPEVVVDFPEAVFELHREFLRAGSEVMVALTYYGHRSKMKVVGREDDLEKLNIQAVKLAKKAAKETGALVAGNICNTWAYNPDDKKTWKQVEDMYREQVQWAVDEGIDFVIAETLEYVGEAEIALRVIKEFKLPAMVTFATTYEESKDGIDWVKGCQILEDQGADIVGLNCIRGPEQMLPILEKIRKNVKCFVAAQPVPYKTTKKYPAFQFLKKDSGQRAFPTELDPFLHTREEMAEFARVAKEMGINYIGICCGAGPHHVRSMAEVLGKNALASRFSADMSQHGLLGSEKVVGSHEKDFLKKWKN